MAWELEALTRLTQVRDIADAIVLGHWPADPEIVDGITRLAASAAQQLRWRDTCREAAA